MIDELKRNIETEIKMLREIAIYSNRENYVSENEKNLIEGVVKSLRESMKILNNSLPEILKEITASKTLPTLPALPKSAKSSKFEKVSFHGEKNKFEAVLSAKDKARFLKELSINEIFLKKLKKKRKMRKEKFEEFKAARGYLKLANRFFLERAKKLTKEGYFKSLSVELRRANIDILFETYVAMILLTTVVSFFAAFLFTIFLFFFNLGLSWPFVSFYDGGYLIRLARIFWIPFVVPVLTFFVLYFYPSTEKKSVGNKINQELPFAVIQMSAVSGSGIAPLEIFKIIGLSREYPHLRAEIRKILNQINLYGYDLVTALNNAARTSPSDRLSELFAGLSTTITSGAKLSEFFEKRAESLLLDYKVEREKYTKLVETFLDIYISVVITAPLVFLLLLVIMSISGLGASMTSGMLGLLSVLGVTLLNVFFLVFLQIKQPVY